MCVSLKMMYIKKLNIIQYLKKKKNFYLVSFYPIKNSLIFRFV